MKLCVSSEPPRRRYQDRIKHGRHLLGEISVTENEKGISGGWESTSDTEWRREGRKDWLGQSTLDCSAALGRVWKVCRGVPVPNLPIKGDPHLPRLAFDLHQPCLAVLGHWLGEAHVKCGFDVKVVISESSSWGHRSIVVPAAGDLKGTFLCLPWEVFLFSFLSLFFKKQG